MALLRLLRSSPYLDLIIALTWELTGWLARQSRPGVRTLLSHLFGAKVHGSLGSMISG
jgi:hypothetical protein